MRKQIHEINIYQNKEKVLWRESVLFNDKRVKNNRMEMNSLDLGEQQHVMTLASRRVSQLERDWKTGHAREESKLFNLDVEVSIGGIVRE